MGHCKIIPQIFDQPYETERFIEKAHNGSYKATDCLLDLLEFSAVAALGGDPFQDFSVEDMESRLKEVYKRIARNSVDGLDAISLALQWAWPPTVNGWIQFVSNEVISAVIGMCEFLKKLPAESMTKNLYARYLAEEVGAFEFFALGSTLYSLEVPRNIVEKYPVLRDGYDNKRPHASRA